MKKILLFLLILINTDSAVSQINNCISEMDSNAVIRIARKKNVYWTEGRQYKARFKFYSFRCECILTSWKISHTNKGDCRYTNGCTVATSATLIINAVTK